MDLPKRIHFHLSIENRWRGVELAALVGALLALTSILVFTAVTFGAEKAGRTPVPALLYPYLACVSVFITTCTWILWAARLGTEHQIEDSSVLSSRALFWWVFGLLFVLLLFSGLAGKPGANAIEALNWYLFGVDPAPSADTNPSILVGMPFAIVAAFANALALGTLAFLAALCRGLIQHACRRGAAAPEPAGIAAMAFGLVDAARRLKHFLVMASALTVTSTLTLFLLFETAAQIQTPEQISRNSQRLVPGSSASSTDRVSPSTGPVLALRCTSSAVPGADHTCELRQTGAQASKRASGAATMALVAGLSFTGVLFVIFVSCGAALDDRGAELARASQEWTRLHNTTFSMKEWRETSGVEDGASSVHVVQALTLAAPALTGLLTLVGSQT